MCGYTNYYNTIIRSETMDTTLCTRFPEAIVGDLDKAIDQKRYMSRSDAVRDYVRRGIREDLKEM